MCTEKHVFLFCATQEWIVVGCCSSGFCPFRLLAASLFFGSNSISCLGNSSSIPCGPDEPVNLCPLPLTCRTHRHCYSHMTLAGSSWQPVAWYVTDPAVGMQSKVDHQIFSLEKLCEYGEIKVLFMMRLYVWGCQWPFSLVLIKFLCGE